MSVFPPGLLAAVTLAVVFAVGAPGLAHARVLTDAPSATTGAGDGSADLAPAPLDVPAFVDGDAAAEEMPSVLAPPETPPAGSPPTGGTSPAPQDGAPGAGTPAAPAPSDGSAPAAVTPDATSPQKPGETGSPVDTVPEDAAPDATPGDTGPSGEQPGDVPDDAAPGDTGPDGTTPAPGSDDEPPASDQPPTQADTGPLPEVHYGEADLPEAVRKTRQAILDAAKTGDIEALRPVLEMSEMPPSLSKNDIGNDPITFLKETSGDPEGREILAILTDLLEAGWVHLDVGKPNEMYVWPYFAAIPVDRLTPPQLVELYRILTATDVDEMRAYQAYLFFKIGIGPDGTWHFFLVDQ